MRITRVALGFFSVGFLAGSFEQAAGLGPGERASEPAPTYRLELAALSLPSGIELAAPASLELVPGAKAEPVAAPILIVAPPEPPARPRMEVGDASAAEWVLGRRLGGDGKAEPISLQPPEAPPPADAKPATRLPEFILPIAKGRVTSLFNQGRVHPAIDLAAPLGSTVYATTRKQRVAFTGWRGGYGNLVITTDPQGRQHYYAHLQRILARVGAVLEQGDVLGLLGSTGHSTGPHVHYEVHTPRGGRVDPAPLLFAGLRVRTGHAWALPSPDASATRLAALRGQAKRRD